jgi:hypothetical protein
MVRSTSNSNNVHRVVDNNSNCYRSMIIDVMKTNQSDASECLIIYEEPNANTTNFF